LTVAIRYVGHTAAFIPPPPPPPASSIGPVLPDSSLVGPRMQPPPPPPGFLPPQLRHRPPMAPPPRMPMPPFMMHGGGGPPGTGRPHVPPGMMAPPPPPPHMLGAPPGMPPNVFHRPMMPMGMPGMRPPPPPMNMPPTSYGNMSTLPPVTTSEQAMQVTPAEQPKTVYAAGPVRTSSKAVESKGLVSSSGTTDVKRMKPRAVTTSNDSIAAPGIELYVPVEKIEAEKKQNSNLAQPTGVSTSAESVTSVPGGAQSAAGKKEKKEKKKKFVRMAAGTVWEDQTLQEWDPGMPIFYLYSAKAMKV